MPKTNRYEKFLKKAANQKHGKEHMRELETITNKESKEALQKLESYFYVNNRHGFYYANRLELYGLDMHDVIDRHTYRLDTSKLYDQRQRFEGVFWLKSRFNKDPWADKWIFVMNAEGKSEADNECYVIPSEGDFSALQQLHQKGYLPNGSKLYISPKASFKDAWEKMRAFYSKKYAALLHGNNRAGIFDKYSFNYFPMGRVELKKDGAVITFGAAFDELDLRYNSSLSFDCMNIRSMREKGYGKLINKMHAQKFGDERLRLNRLLDYKHRICTAYGLNEKTTKVVVNATNEYKCTKYATHGKHGVYNPVMTTYPLDIPCWKRREIRKCLTKQ